MFVSGNLTNETMIDYGRKNNTVVLFDMDGTLTPPRQPLDRSLIPSLVKISELATIGIVSGSPLSYINQQMDELWTTIGGVLMDKVILLPCNGTQLYQWAAEERRFLKKYGLDLKAHLEKTCEKASLYKELIQSILFFQLQFMNDHQGFLEFTGNFVSYRDSMINWSMIGRDAGVYERAAFKNLDAKIAVRHSLCRALELRIEQLGLGGLVEFALGGTTSIDIYPTGWDKTHALRHFDDAEVWFVGDKCEPGGNDHSIYSALLSTQRSFSTSSTYRTGEILEQCILPKLEKMNG